MGNRRDNASDLHRRVLLLLNPNFQFVQIAPEDEVVMNDDNDEDLFDDEDDEEDLDYHSNQGSHVNRFAVEEAPGPLRQLPVYQQPPTNQQGMHLWYLLSLLLCK